MKRFTIALMLAALLLWDLACEQNRESGASVRDQMAISHDSRVAVPSIHPEPVESPPPVPASQPAKLPARPVAIVNGGVIERKDLIDLLIQTHGLPILQQLMLREAAASEGRKKGLSISEVDIEAEYDFTLQAEHLNGKDIEKLTPVRREQMIDEWTRSRGVTREELRIAMERQAWLRKLIGPPAPIDDADLKKEYDRVHGEKVEVRHLQLAAARFFPPVKARLDKGESFESLVAEYSQNAFSRNRGGLLPPFSASDDTVTTVLAKAAFAMKVGEYSNPIEALGAFHVIKLEKRIPPDGVPFDQVRATLLRHLEARRMMQSMQDLGSRLLMQAELRIEDPVLREQYKKAQAAKQISGPILLGQ